MTSYTHFANQGIDRHKDICFEMGNHSTDLVHPNSGEGYFLFPLSCLAH